MSRRKKLQARLLSRPTDFTFGELNTLLKQFGYVQDNKGQTSGSRVIYHHPVTNHVIFLHRPHPGNILKRYQVNYLIEALQKNSLL